MAKKKYSGKAFWVRQVSLAVVLIIAAAIVIYWQQNTSDDTPERSVSKGLSDFYSQFRMGPKEEELTEENFVIDINGSKESLENRLQTMASDLRPVKKSWVGEHKHRSFKAGSTLREAISAYAEKEGMQVIWNLDQDFVIKHHFQMDDTLAGSLAKIATAIDSNFDGEVEAFVCPGQRTLVVTAKPSDFLDENCRKR